MKVEMTRVDEEEFDQDTPGVVFTNVDINSDEDEIPSDAMFLGMHDSVWEGLNKPDKITVQVSVGGTGKKLR